ncbi:MAG: 4Fe-4S dicluster domain-containing protein [candidate division WOR-3 bacterium]
MDAYFLPNHRCSSWLASLAGRFNLFYPREVDEAVHWQRYDANDFNIEQLALRKIRAAEPIKPFFFSPRERVASFPEPVEPETKMKPTLLFGVKGCDLRGIAVHKRMFLEGEFADPFFAQRLNNTILLGADCPAPERTCFCNLLGLKPFLTEDVDLSLTVIDDGWLIEALSERGAELMQMENGLQKATDSQIAKREEQRQKAMRILKEQNPKDWNPNLAQAIADKTADKRFWIDAARDCVECFGCLLTCPTCFCFLLYDQGNAERFERSRVWDFCYLPMYARVGGGANPRARFIDRFINRFHCKFMHSKNQNGFYACSGCGRCFSTCMGRIDIRNILGQL